MYRLSLITLVAMLGLSEAARAQNPQQTNSPPAQTPAPAPAAGQVPPTAQVESAAQDVQGFLEPFVYDPRGRRDPFKPYGGISMENAPKKPILDPAAPLLVEGKPLQSYDLDQFTLVAVMWDIITPKAMFLDPRSQIHIVGRDERIGRKNGYIAAIREGEVVVVEQIKNDQNQVSYATKVLRIQR